MRYRRLDANGDGMYGHGQADFLRDSPEAVGQAVLTRLRLLLGEWFLDQAEGTPYVPGVLGKYTMETYDQVIRERILGTPGVTAITEYSSQLDRETRVLTVACTIDTDYGQAVIEERF